MSGLIWNSEELYRQNKKGVVESTSYFVHRDDEGTVTLDRLLTNEVSKKDKTYQSVIKAKPTKPASEIAITKAQHKIVVAKRDGWTTDYDEAVRGVFVKQPQLLHKYSKAKAKVQFPCIIQPKLDGVRCLWDPETKKLMSRKSKEYIHPDVRYSLTGLNDFLDGELYIHGNKLQDTVKAVKNGSSEPIFYVFDMPTRNGETYQQRLKLFKDKHSGIYNGQIPKVRLVSTTVCNSHEDILKIFKDYVNLGYEGAVVKNLKGVYLWNDRSYDVLKVKGFIQDGELVDVMSSEFKIVDVVSDQLSSGGEGIAYICQEPKSLETFKVTPKMSHEERRRAWEAATLNPAGEGTVTYINQQLTVEYRGLTNDNIPIHAVGICVRNYE